MTKNAPINAQQIPEYSAKSLYPEPFASMVKHRTRRKLGDYFGLTNFGINFTTLAPSSISALKHHHSKQDECSGQEDLATVLEFLSYSRSDSFGVSPPLY